MDQDQVKGKAKDIAGAVERKVGEWTGDKKTEAKGAIKQGEGKLQNAWGTVKDAVRHPPKSEANKDADEETASHPRAAHE
jgi:uncharacterized protein YjbJ (UPF0337 family)